MQFWKISYLYFVPSCIRFTEYQKNKISETISKVRTAINKLINDRSLITKPKLVKETGLSRSTFDKQHVLDVLKEFGLCEFSKMIKPNTLSSPEVKKIAKLEKENLLLKNK